MLDYQRHIAVQTDDFELDHEYQCLRSHSATGRHRHVLRAGSGHE